MGDKFHHEAIYRGAGEIAKLAGQRLTLCGAVFDSSNCVTLTGHSVKEIMNEYVALDTQNEMQKYFNYATLLLKAIKSHGEALGCARPLTDVGWRNGYYLSTLPSDNQQLVDG